MKTEPTGAKLLDAVRARCVAALLLGAISLILVLADYKFSLLPITLGLSLILTGKTARTRNAPPVTFLLLLPIIISIARILIARR